MIAEVSLCHQYYAAMEVVDYLESRFNDVLSGGPLGNESQLIEDIFDSLHSFFKELKNSEINSAFHELKFSVIKFHLSILEADAKECLDKTLLLRKGLVNIKAQFPHPTVEELNGFELGDIDFDKLQTMKQA
ncbi:MAG: hypothetical protein AB8E15_05260 [Bdellovibrionales bacterium]